ncbi:ankyrin [Amniculicola lignicola CBS 123094]|uniref:Ankyrin n=1 Tax=Amniculicola lignicola CBS 123094 TaxID=1392246 RepID=A0A6A5WCF3_9PLEO|nr:ankyrin [Amniculicola lignicola CBS 123094]
MDVAGPARKRKASLSPRPPKKGRGRPSKWSESHLKILVILRLCGFQLSEILELIHYFTKGDFQPKPRNSQQVLQDFLSDGYLRHCTVDSETLRQRIRFVKQVKAARRREPGQEQDAHVERMLDRIQTPSTDRAIAERYEPENKETLLEHQIQLFARSPLPNIPSDSPHRKQSTATSSIISCSSFTSRNDQILRHLLHRGSRTSSCISEIASLLGRFSFTGSQVSLPSTNETTPAKEKSGQNREIHPILQEHLRQCHDANTALIASCKGCSDTKDCLHQTIMRSITTEASQRLNINTIEVNPQDQSPFAREDPWGNNLLFFAARSGAPLAMLLDIIHNTPDLHTFNDEGQTFLFVLDPTGLSDSRYVVSHFSTLIGALERRQYTFESLDHSGRSFLSLLCVRPEFDIHWISQLCARSVDWMSRMRRLARLRDRSGAYLVDYLNSHPDAANLAIDISQLIRKPSHLPEEHDDGSTPLHYELAVPISRPTHFFPYYKNYANRYDKNGNTPLHKWAQATKDWIAGGDEGRGFALKRSISLLHQLVGMGANINAKDRAGNTTLHLVAPYLEIELQRALLCNGALLNLKNGNGHRPIDHIIDKLQKHVKKSKKSHVQLCARAFTCAWNLLEHGAQFEGSDRRRRSESSHSSASSQSSGEK